MDKFSALDGREATRTLSAVEVESFREMREKMKVDPRGLPEGHQVRKRMKVLDRFRKERLNKPEWMILEVFRSCRRSCVRSCLWMAALRHSNDWNDLYRRASIATTA